MTAPELLPVAGSYRDPAGQVFLSGERVFRTVSESALEDFNYVRDSAVFPALMENGSVVEEFPVDHEVQQGLGLDAPLVIEHPRLKFISHPYEWCFEALKAAALLHLDIQIASLQENISLSDASAYNIQFIGALPIFIDALSFQRYQEGDFWAGHQQFCRQFLNPLLLHSHVGIAHNQFYAGALEGIDSADLAAMLPFRYRFSLRILTHVILPSKLNAAKIGSKVGKETLRSAPFPKTSYERMLQKLHAWISGLTPKDRSRATWRDYAKRNTYSERGGGEKHRFVKECVAAAQAKSVWDLGCNIGSYSAAAIEAGCEHVIGWDSDQGALDAALLHARDSNLPFTPLYFDAADPAADRGWQQSERQGFMARANAEMVLALAFIHHLIIARNIPVDRVIDWLCELAPAFVVEFVPKSDPTVKQMLQLRDDVFADYTIEHFRTLLRARTRIESECLVPDSDRVLFFCNKN